jgi:hypothetical protein
VIGNADLTLIDNVDYLQIFGLGGRRPQTARQIWRHLADACLAEGDLHSEISRPLDIILEKGCLARRILAAMDGDFSRENLHRVYGTLCDCLSGGYLFDP